MFITSFMNFLTRAITYDVAVMWPHYFWVAVICASARCQ